MHRCARCERHLPAGSFRPNPKMRQGLNSWCKSCSLDATQEWRSRNRAAINAQRRADYDAQRVFHDGVCQTCGATFRTTRRKLYCDPTCRRAWKRHQRQWRPSTHQKRLILERDDWRCYLCRSPIPSDTSWPHPLSATVDHVVPMSAGGSSRNDNLRAAHWHCNQEKGDRLLGIEMGYTMEAA